MLKRLRIDQHIVLNAEAGSNYLLGAYNVDWSSTIIEMFSRKLDKLNIVNPDYPGYLEQSSAEILMEVGKIMQEIVIERNPTFLGTNIQTF